MSKVSNRLRAIASVDSAEIYKLAADEIESQQRELAHLVQEVARVEKELAESEKTVENILAREARLQASLHRAIAAFGNIRTMIDGRIDTVDDEDGPQPNIFGQIETQCAVGLGEAP